MQMYAFLLVVSIFLSNQLLASWHVHSRTTTISPRTVTRGGEPETIEVEVMILDASAELCERVGKPVPMHELKESNCKFLRIKDLPGEEFPYCLECNSFNIRGACGSLLHPDEEAKSVVQTCKRQCLGEVSFTDFLKGAGVRGLWRQSNTA